MQIRACHVINSNLVPHPKHYEVRFDIVVGTCLLIFYLILIFEGMTYTWIGPFHVISEPT